MIRKFKASQLFFSLCLMCIVGIAGGVWAAQRIPTIYLNMPQVDMHTASFDVPPPKTLNLLVGHADLIVIGTIDRIVQEGMFQGYDAEGNFVAGQPYQYSEEHPVDPNVPFVDYEIKVERVIADDGTVRAGNPVIGRAPIIFKDKDDPRYSKAFPALGDHRLFFLSQTPDGKAYGAYYGMYGRFVIDGPVTTFADSEYTPVVFNGQEFALDPTNTEGGVPPDTFIKAVEKIAIR